ncbi:MAG: hypothetical protein GF401_00125 [Chitinivibrionales bacterium]|nr:hypothetical protein [Chitinivibrionales bacterium]
MKAVITGGSLQARNMGIRALTTSCIQCLDHARPDIEITVMDYEDSDACHSIALSGKTRTVPLIHLRLSKNLALRNNLIRVTARAILDRLLFHTKRPPKGAVASALHEADFVVSLAGGDSFSDIYGIKRLIYIAAPQLPALLYNKKLILAPQTIGPFSGIFARYLGKFILKRSSRVFVRDMIGYTWLRSVFPEDHVENKFTFCNDMAFILEMHKPPAIPPLPEHGPCIGLNISGLLFIGGYTGKNMFGLKDDYRSLIHRIIELSISTLNHKMLIISHVMGVVQSVEDDYKAAENIYNSLPSSLRENTVLIPPDYDQHEIKYFISKCDFFIGSRMHACIGSLSQQIPAVGLAYSDKFKGVYRSISMEDLVIDLKRNTGEQIIESIISLHSHKDDFQARLASTMPRIKEKVLNVYSAL